MSGFDPEAYFNTLNKALVSTVSDQSAPSYMSAKQQEVAEASQRNLDRLKRIHSQHQSNQQNSLVGKLGLDPDRGVGPVLNTLVSSADALQDIATFASEPLDQATDMSGLIAVQEDGTKPSSIQRRVLGDGVITGVKGAIAVPEFAVGLADMVSGGHAGKSLEDAGFRPEEAKQFLDGLKTWEQQQADGSAQNAEGFWNTLAAIAENPSVVPHAVTESVPAMLAGGLLGRGLQALGMGVKAAAAVGEGTVMAGSAAEGIRQQTDDGLLSPKQIAASGATGVLGTAINRVSGGLATKTGFGDVDEALVRGTLGTTTKPPVPQAIGAAGFEGAEEALQSSGEQILQNYALDRPLDQGVGNAAAMGLVTGAAMGSVMGGSRSEQQQAEAAEADKASYEQAAATGDVSAFLDESKAIYSPVKAVAALKAHSQREETPAAVKEQNLAQITQISESLDQQIKDVGVLLARTTTEGKAKLQNTLVNQQAALLQADPTDTAAITGIQETIGAIEQSLALDPKPLNQKLETLKAQAAQVKAAIENWDAGVQVEAIKPSNVELADTDVSTLTPEQAPAVEKAVSSVLTLAMQRPDKVDPVVAQRLAENPKNSLTEAQRVVLRTLSKARQLENEFKDLEQVRQDVLEGNEAQNYKGLKTYQNKFYGALKAGNTKMANQQRAGLQKFAARHTEKAEIAQAGLEEALATGKQVQYLPIEGGGWIKADRSYSDAEIKEKGGMTLHSGTVPMVEAIQQEADLLNAGLASMEAVYALKTGTPETAAAPVQKTVSEKAKTKPAEQKAEAVKLGAKQEKVPKPETPVNETTPVKREQGLEKQTVSSPPVDRNQEVTSSTSEVVSTDSTSPAKVAAPTPKEAAAVAETEAQGDMNQAVSEAIKPRATGKLAVMDESQEGKEFPNLLATSFTQESGNPDNGTERPLVAAHNLLSRWIGEWVSALDFLDQSSLTEEQKGLEESFVLQANTWLPKIQGLFDKKTDEKYFYKDFTQFFMDAEGNVEENVKTAIAAAVYGWLADTVNDGMTNKDPAINAIIHKGKEEKVTQTTRAKFIDVGVRQPVVINELGAQVMQILGFKLNKNASKSHKARLESAMGTIALKLMESEGLIENHVIMGSEFEVYHTKTPAEEKMTEEAYAKEVAKRAQQKHHFIRIKGTVQKQNGFLKRIPNADADKIARSVKGTSGFLDKVFGTSNAGQPPSFKPLEFNQKTANNSERVVSSKEEEAHEKEAKAPYVIDQDMWSILDQFSDEDAWEVSGVRGEDPSQIQRANRLGIKAKNDGLKREWAQLKNWVNETKAIKGTIGKPFYIVPEAWKNFRAGYGSFINPQTSKIHRAVVGKKSAKTVIRWTEDDQTNLNAFKLRVAEGLGVDTGKQSNEVSLEDYKKLMAKPVFQDAVKAIQKGLSGSPLEAADVLAIKEGAKAGGANLHSLAALVGQAQYEEGKANKLFTTHLTAEVDGVANGPTLAQMLFGAFDSLEQAFNSLVRGGFFPTKFPFAHYSAWRGTAGNSDLYEVGASHLIQHVQGRLAQAKAGDQLGSAMLALEYVTGKLDKNGSPTSAGRKTMKPPITKNGYGEGIDSTIDGMADDFIQQVYDHIQAINAGKPGIKVALKPLLESVNQLLAYGDKQAQQLDASMDISAAMELVLTPRQEDALKNAYRRTLGESVKAVMKEDFKVFSGRRSQFNKAAGLAYELYTIVYQAKKQALIAELVRTGQMRVDQNGQPIEDLSVEQERELAKTLAEIAPVFHTALSKASGQREAAFVLPKSKKVASREADYLSEVKFKPVGPLATKSLKVAGSTRVAENPGVGGAVGGVHSFDAAVSLKAGMQVDSINIHDARLYGIGFVFEGARSLNQQTYEQALAYSPMDEILETLERSIKGLAKEIQEGDQSGEMHAALVQLLTAEYRKLNKGEKAAAKEAGGLVRFRLDSLREEARAATLMQLDILANTGVVDQYAFEGGQYNVPEEGRQRARDAREARANKRDDLEATVAAVALDKLRWQDPKAKPVKQAEPEIEAEAPVQEDVVEPTNQEAPTSEPTGDTPFGPLGNSTANNPELVAYLQSKPALTSGELITFLYRRLSDRKGQRTPDFYRELLKQLHRTADLNIPVRLLTAENIPAGVAASENVDTALGWFHVDEQGNASINIKGPGFKHSAVTDELLIHELVHAAVARAVEQVEKGTLKGEAVALVTELDEIRARAAKYIADNNLQGTHGPAVVSTQELIAWGMTNVAFQREVLVNVPIKSSTRKTGLVSAMQEFIQTIGKIVFRGSDKSRQKQQVTGLSVLFANVAGLMQEAQNQRDADVRPTSQTMTLKQESVDPLDQVMGFTTEQVYDALGEDATSVDDPIFDNHLRGLLDGIVSKLHGPYGAFKAEMTQQQAVSPLDAYLKSKYTGDFPFTSRTLTSGFEIHDQEGFVLEQVEAVIAGSLSDTTTLAYKELDKLAREASKRIKPSDLHSDPVKAQAMWDFAFKADASSGTSDHLARFAALALTHQPFAQLMGFATDTGVDPQPNTLFGQLMAFFTNVLNVFYQKVGMAYGGQQADEKLLQVVDRLVDIEAKYRARKANTKASYSEKLESSLQDVSNKAKDKIEAWGRSDTFKKSKNGFVKASGSVLSAVVGDRLQYMTEGLKKMAIEQTEGRMGFAMGLLNEMQGANENTQEHFELLRATKHIEKNRMDVRTNTQQLIIESFANKGKDLSAATKEAFSRVFLRTGAADLLGPMNLDQIRTMLADQKARNQTIKDLQTQLKGKYQHFYQTSALRMGYRMATGKVKGDLVQMNPMQVAMLYGTDQAGKVTQAQAEAMAPIISQLATLHALNYQNQGDIQLVLNAWAIENQRTDQGNGIEMVLKAHKQLLDEARQKVFEDSELLMVKGYVPEMYQPNVEVVVAEASMAAELVAQGWLDHGQVKTDKFDPDNARAKRIFSIDRGMLGRVTGTVSNTGERRKGNIGTSLIEDPLNATSSRKITRMLESRKRQAIRELFKPNPNYDPAKDDQSYMAPVFNAEGKVVGHRYMMSEQFKDDLLRKDTRNKSFDMILGTLASSTYDKASSRKQNREVVHLLHQQWEAEYTDNPKGYLVFGPDSNDPELVEMYRELPQDMRMAIKEFWGTPNMLVRRDLLDLHFGYRKFSLSNMFGKTAEERKAWENFFVWFTEDFLRLDKKAALRVRQAEDIWQAIVKETKDIIVVKSGMTLLWNVVSNYSLLWWYGVPLSSMWRSSLVAYKGAMNWQRDSARLAKLQAMKDSGYIIGSAADLDNEIAKLQDSLARNPVRTEIEAGMMPSIVEDVEQESNPYSYQGRLGRWAEPKVQKIPQGIRTAARWMYMAHDTPAYQFLSQQTQLSDFVARHALYEHATTRKNNPLGQREALQLASEAFVNYDIPSHRSLQYLNDMGIVWFTKYYMRIQKMIMHLYKENPARGMLLLTIDGYLDAAQTLVDSAAINRIENPFSVGAFKFIDALDEIPTVKGLLGMVD